MKKRVISILTATTMASAPLAAFGADPLGEMKDLGIMNGYEDGEMHGGDKLTRAQAITMIMRSGGFDDAKWYKSEVKLFEDLPLAHWSSGYVYKAAYDKMINGVSETEYAPEANVTYEQAAKMIIGVLGLGDETMVYPDDYMKKAEEIGMLKGIGASLGDEITREQFAAMLCNVLDYKMKDTTLRSIIEEDIKEEEEDEYTDYYAYGESMLAEDSAVMAAPIAGASAGTVSKSASAGGGGSIGAAASAVSRSPEVSTMIKPDSSYPADVERPAVVDEPPIIDDGFIPPAIDDGWDWDDSQLQAGKLTAGRWSDFKNLDFWNKLMQNQEYSEMQSKWEIPVDVDSVKPDPEVSEDVLDLMFTIDTTGSMGDELAYIKAELKDVVERLDTHVRVSCNYYRDHGDSYVVRSYPFSTNIDKVVRQISKQYASGGGDWEEAVDEALLDSVNNHDWSESARSKLLFMVLDAPPHFEQDVVKNIQDAVADAVEKGIHIIPIASSGIDKETEFFLRTIALATGGTYIFLTDDSGIGYSHIEPTVGQYEVKLLNELILEVIKEYIGQDYDLPEPTEEPIPSGDPEPTEEPVPTEEPIPTDEPEPTEEPEPTDEPEPTEEPEPTDEPEETEAPDDGENTDEGEPNESGNTESK